MYNILIVDDEKIERNGIKLLLKLYGHKSWHYRGWEWKRSL